MPSNIFHLLPEDVCASECDICGRQVILRFEDRTTGQRFGVCCHNEAVLADQVATRMLGRCCMWRENGE